MSKRISRTHYRLSVVLSAVLGLIAGFSVVFASQSILAAASGLPAQVSAPDSCSDSDGGNVVTVPGSVTGMHDGRSYAFADLCSGNALYENTCQGTTPVQTSTLCPFGCQNGACVRVPSPASYSCSDTDGGANFAVQGTLTVSYYGTTNTHTDTCVGNVLYENECDPDAARQITVRCRYGCSNGACLIRPNLPAPGPLPRPVPRPQPILTTCTDSDGGIFYHAKGTMSGRLRGQAYTFTDSCASRTIIHEYYCKGSVPIRRAHVCRLGCTDGTCIGEW